MSGDPSELGLLHQRVGDLLADCERLSGEVHRATVILDSVADGITVQDATGRLIYANDAAARLAGLDTGAQLLELSGPEVLARFELLDEVSRPFPLEKLPGRIALAERRQAEAVIGYRRRDSGETRWSVVHAAPLLDPHGELAASVNIFSDITARRNDEDARRFVHDTSQEMVRSLDVDQALFTLARAFVARICDYCLVYVIDERGGLARRAEASRDPDREHLLHRLRTFTVDPGMHSPPWRAVSTKQTVLAEDIDTETLTAMARTPEWLALVQELGVRSTLTVPLVARGEAIGAVGLVLAEPNRSFSRADLVLAEELCDRAALAILNARLYASEQAARHKAESVAYAREQLLAVVSHDLRTPLAATSMALGALEALLPSTEVDGWKALSIIRRSSENMFRLISDLLDLARINAGTLRVEKAAHDFESVLRESIQLLTPIAQEKGLLLAVEGGCEGAQVLCDRDRIFQVMSNLVGNAIKFTPEGGEVVVRLARDPGAVLVRVHDQGPGIDPAELDLVFERYWQSGSAMDDKGIGLGLSIAKGIVEAHGGAIQVDSAPGSGSVFAFKLPV